jgi:tetratricopeptide (TPR) repeat protein
LAKYKKRARELKHDRFRDTTMLLADRLFEKLIGRGRQILYVLAGIVLLSAVAYGIVRWRHKHADEAAAAMGRAIAIMRADVSLIAQPNALDPIFSSEQERAQRAIEEFQKIVVKYGEPYQTEAKYFIATQELVTDRIKGETDLQALSQGSGEVAVLSKFALAQAREVDGSLDQAAALYSEIAQLNTAVVTPETAKLQLALVYDKQGKKKEAAEILFSIVEAARKAKDKDGKPIPETAAARAASQKLLGIDPTRFAQLPPAPTQADLAF